MTTVVQDIPVTPGPERFNVELDGAAYSLFIHWNITDSAWYMDLEGVTNGVVLRGLKLITGPDLLLPYAIIELGSLYVTDTTGAEQDPDFDNWGDDYLLAYVEKA